MLSASFILREEKACYDKPYPFSLKNTGHKPAQKVTKAVPLHAMAALGGGGEVWLLLILDLDTRWG
jgi:hypothetical protein